MQKSYCRTIGHLWMAAALAMAGTFAQAQMTVDYYQNGLSAYQGRNFNRSITLMSQAAQQNPKNINALFYLGLSYAQMNQTSQARDTFELILRMVPADSEMAVRARNNVAFLTKQQITQVSSLGKANQVMAASFSSTAKVNYLPYVIINGQVVHFALNRMPLKIFIDNGTSVRGWKLEDKAAVRYAMQIWQAATSNHVRFTEVSRAENADITVSWQANFKDNILGVSPFQSFGATIIRSDINLAVDYPGTANPIPAGELATIATHELGHAIGLKGHSPYPADIMYFSSNHTAYQKPSLRDINTINLLYQLDADVQNNGAGSTVATKNYMDLYARGTVAQKAQRFDEAIGYYRRAIALDNTLPQAKFNLGAILINQGTDLARANRLNDAQQYLQEAITLYREVLAGTNPPPSSGANLQVALTNFDLINKALSASR